MRLRISCGFKHKKWSYATPFSSRLPPCAIYMRYKVARGDQKAKKFGICSDGFKVPEWDLGESQTECRGATSNEINAIREWTTEGLVNHVHGGIWCG